MLPTRSQSITVNDAEAEKAAFDGVSIKSFNSSLAIAMRARNHWIAFDKNTHGSSFLS